MKRFALPAIERIKSPLEVSAVYQSNRKVFAFPIMAFYHVEKMPSPTEQVLRVAFSAPKRRFKRAVDRNRIKRRMREAYRLQKHELATSVERKDLAVKIVFIYTGPLAISFEKLKTSFFEIIAKINAQQVESH